MLEPLGRTCKRTCLCFRRWRSTRMGKQNSRRQSSQCVARCGLDSDCRGTFCRAPWSPTPVALTLHPQRLSATHFWKTAFTRANKLRKPASHRPRHRRARSAHGTTTRRWSRRDMLPGPRALNCLRAQRVHLSRQPWTRTAAQGEGRLTRLLSHLEGRASDRHTLPAFGSSCRICSLLQKRTAVA